MNELPSGEFEAEIVHPVRPRLVEVINVFGKKSYEFQNPKYIANEIFCIGEEATILEKFAVHLMHIVSISKIKILKDKSNDIITIQKQS
jgi:hypothetical protein